MSKDTKWVEIINEGALWVYQKMLLTYKRKKKSLGTIHDQNKYLKKDRDKFSRANFMKHY